MGSTTAYVASADRYATNVTTTTQNTKSPKSILANMQQQEYETFQKDYLPLLEQYQKDMTTRRADYAADAANEAISLSRLQQNTATDRRQALGVDLSREQQVGQGRKNALNLTQALVTGQNKAVDTADEVNLDTANKLMDVTTGMRNDAISNASAASGMASNREAQGAQNRANASNQKTQMAATVATIAVMI